MRNPINKHIHPAKTPHKANNQKQPEITKNTKKQSICFFKTPQKTAQPITTRSTSNKKT
jgi:hypothetical protein